MKIAAITRYKLGSLYAALKELGWTQTDLAQRAGLGVQVVGRIINLHMRPTPEVARKLHAAFQEAGVFFNILEEWPECFEGVQPNYRLEQIQEVEITGMLESPEVRMLEAPSEHNDRELRFRHCLEIALAKLPAVEARALRMRFFENATLREIGKTLTRSADGARIVVDRGLRKLRKPCNLAAIQSALSDELPDVDGRLREQPDAGEPVLGSHGDQGGRSGQGPDHAGAGLRFAGRLEHLR